MEDRPLKTINVEELTAAAFLPYGHFAQMINPDMEKLGAPPVEFYRDMVQEDLGGASIASFSVCRVEKRDYMITVSEYHTRTGEGILPLDNDVLIHVAPATPPNAPVPVDKIRAFRVPKGTMVTLRPGIWHHAPWTVNDQPASVLIVLPERTYANDCIVIKHSDEEKIKIAM
jgi:ureidoglycolate lyase